MQNSGAIQEFNSIITPFRWLNRFFRPSPSGVNSHTGKEDFVPLAHIQSHLKQFLKPGSPNLLKQLETNNLKHKSVPLFNPHPRDRGFTLAGGACPKVWLGCMRACLSAAILMFVIPLPSFGEDRQWELVYPKGLH